MFNSAITIRLHEKSTNHRLDTDTSRTQFVPRKTEEGYTYSELAITIMGFPFASQAHSMESMMAI